MTLHKTRLPLVFIGPGLLVLAVLALVPTVFAIAVSLQDRELGQSDICLLYTSPSPRDS